MKDKLNPNGDIEIKYTGLRPGEKLYEELLCNGENMIPTNDSYQENMITWDELKELLDD